MSTAAPSDFKHVRATGPFLGPTSKEGLLFGKAIFLRTLAGAGRGSERFGSISTLGAPSPEALRTHVF